MKVTFNWRKKEWVLTEAMIKVNSKLDSVRKNENVACGNSVEKVGFLI